MLNAYIKEQKDNEKSIGNIVANIERGFVSKATNNRLQELEARQEELEKLILIEQSKASIKVTEKQIRTVFEQALKYEPQMIINYLIKEIVLYDDRIEIIYNSPLDNNPNPKNTNPDDTSRGFCFYLKKIRLCDSYVIVYFMI